MGFYNDLLLPRLLDHAMRKDELVGYRRRVVGAARGRVLEVGIGSGLNLPFYGPSVTEIIGLEPSQPLVEMASRRAREDDKTVSFLPASAEAIPLDASSVDTVVTTWTMCSIPDAGAALAEMRRVLRPGGDLLFVEMVGHPIPGSCASRIGSRLPGSRLPAAAISIGRSPISSEGRGSEWRICGPAMRRVRSRSPSCTKAVRREPDR